MPGISLNSALIWILEPRACIVLKIIIIIKLPECKHSMGKGSNGKDNSGKLRKVTALKASERYDRVIRGTYDRP
jgi:hypothetical protein